MLSKNQTISFIIITSLFFILGCKQEGEPVPNNVDFRQEMRNLVIEISAYARGFDSEFLIIPQNGQELITKNGKIDGALKTNYLNAINASGREDLFYGYNNDNEATPGQERQYLLELCLLFEQNNVEILTTDYCSSPPKIDDSYEMNFQNHLISFAADERDLNNIPAYPAVPFNVNDNNITNISEVRNFLYLINSENYFSKQDFINAVSRTNYDLIIMDLFHDKVIYTQQEIAQLKTKQNGGKRLVMCYMSIGEAEDYRYYWQDNWNISKPEWLGTENPEWEGNYKVWYWDKEWQNIIFGNENSYLKRIINVGFDGTYLDLIDAFEYFEQQ